MKEFIVLVQESDDELDRWYFECMGEDVEHATEQALDHGNVYVIAVYERVA